MDNLARGFVLQLTEVMPPGQKVLATDPQDLQRRLELGELSDYRRILYLPMDDTARDARPQTLVAARQGGLAVQEPSVVHAGMYEVALFERQGDGSLASHQVAPTSK